MVVMGGGGVIRKDPNARLLRCQQGSFYLSEWWLQNGSFITIIKLYTNFLLHHLKYFKSSMKFSM